MDADSLRSLAQYDGIKKPALKEICVTRGIEPTHSVTELIAQLHDNDEGLDKPPKAFVRGTGDAVRVKNESYRWDKSLAINSESKNLATAVNKWKLQPPLNTSLTEAAWEAYNTSRDKVASKSAGFKGEEFDDSDLETEDPQGALRRSREALNKLIDRDRTGNSGDDLYLTEWFINDYCGTPRSVDVTTRWYSPLATGKYIELIYKYHSRSRLESLERFSRLGIRFGVTVDPSEAPTNEDTKNSLVVFKMTYSNLKSKEKRLNASLRILKAFEEHMFATNGAIAPLALYTMLLSAGTVNKHGEDSRWLIRVGRRRFDFDPPSPPEKTERQLQEEQDEEYDSNETDRDRLEEQMVEQRKNVEKAQKAWMATFSPFKRPGIPDQFFVDGIDKFLAEAMPVLSDSEDAPSDDEPEGDEEENEWETEDEDTDADTDTNEN